MTEYFRDEDNEEAQSSERESDREKEEESARETKNSDESEKESEIDDEMDSHSESEDGNDEESDTRRGRRRTRRGVAYTDLPATTAALSEYEQRRLENIKRNESFLQGLGIAQRENEREPRGEKEKEKANKRARLRRRETETEREGEAQPVRRSARLSRGDSVDDAPLLSLYTEREHTSRPRSEGYRLEIDLDDEEEGERQRITSQSLRDFIASRNSEHLEEISDEVIEHTAYRMSYMSSKALATRAKAIARSAGKHSKEKLLAFHYALELANLHTLAAATGTALARLGEVMDS